MEFKEEGVWGSSPSKFLNYYMQNRAILDYLEINSDTYTGVILLRKTMGDDKGKNTNFVNECTSLIIKLKENIWLVILIKSLNEVTKQNNRLILLRSMHTSIFPHGNFRFSMLYLKYVQFGSSPRKFWDKMVQMVQIWINLDYSLHKLFLSFCYIFGIYLHTYLCHRINSFVFYI